MTRRLRATDVVKGAGRGAGMGSVGMHEEGCGRCLAEKDARGATRRGAVEKAGKTTTTGMGLRLRREEEGEAEEVRAGREPDPAAERDADLGVDADGGLRGGAVHASVRGGRRHVAREGPSPDFSPAGKLHHQQQFGFHFDSIIWHPSPAHVKMKDEGHIIFSGTASYLYSISTNGVISNVTLRQPDSSGGTLTYEGHFELSLSGSFVPTENSGTRSRSGGMSVSLASPDGHVVGGGVAGLLVEASPVQIIVGSFLPSYQMEQKNKKLRVDAPPAPTQTPPAVPISSINTLSSEQGQQMRKKVICTMLSVNLVMSRACISIWNASLDMPRYWMQITIRGGSE
ncbi:hypothetical protein ABZP36_007828 [Zizania latifolia]